MAHYEGVSSIEGRILFHGRQQKMGKLLSKLLGVFIASAERGEIAAHEELKGAWGQKFVSDRRLHGAIRRLRPHCAAMNLKLKNIRGVGYRIFHVPPSEVRRRSVKPSLVVEPDDGTRHAIRLAFGRHGELELVKTYRVAARRVKRKRCRFVMVGVHARHRRKAMDLSASLRIAETPHILFVSSTLGADAVRRLMAEK